MTSNPLMRSAESVSSGSTIRPGDVRTINARDKEGQIIRTLTLYRTDRPYAEDLADAYNDALPDEQRRMGLQWMVMPNGELKLGEVNGYSERRTKELERDREEERRRWIWRHRNPERVTG